MNYNEMIAMTAADLHNNGQDLAPVIQWFLDDVTAACKKYPTSSRDAGVAGDPQKIISDPPHVMRVTWEDRDMVSVHIMGAGLTSPAAIPLSADQVISDWCNEDLLGALPA